MTVGCFCLQNIPFDAELQLGAQSRKETAWERGLKKAKEVSGKVFSWWNIEGFFYTNCSVIFDRLPTIPSIVLWNIV